MSKSILSLFAVAAMVATSSCKEQIVEAQPVPLVKTMVVEAGGQSECVDYPAIIKPQDELSIAFRVNGQIEMMLDKSGMEVKKGALLATLDAHDYEVSLEAASAAYRQSDNEFARIKQLYDSKTISPNDFEKAEATHKVVCSKYQAARDAFEYTKIQAPFDGYIQNVYHQKGEVVQAGMPVMSFISKQAMKVEVFLPFRDYERMDSLIDSRLEMSGEYFTLQFGSISHQANAAQLYKAEFHIFPDDIDGKIVAGKNCQVKLTFASSTETGRVRVPLSAVMNVGNEASVWVVDNQNIVAKVGVKIWNIDHDMATVSGLKVGQQVVTSGIHVIKEGEAVKIMPAPSKTNIGGML